MALPWAAACSGMGPASPEAVRSSFATFASRKLCEPLALYSLRTTCAGLAGLLEAEELLMLRLLLLPVCDLLLERLE